MLFSCPFIHNRDKIKASLNCSPSGKPIFPCLTIINKCSPFLCVCVASSQFYCRCVPSKTVFYRIDWCLSPFFGLLALLFFWKVVDKFTRNKWSSPLGQYIILNGVLIRGCACLFMYIMYTPPNCTHLLGQSLSTSPYRHRIWAKQCHLLLCGSRDKKIKASVKVPVSSDAVAAGMVEDGTATTAFLFLFG